MTAEQIRAIRYLRNGMASGADVQKTCDDGCVIVKTGYGLVLIAPSGRRFNDKSI